MGEGSPKGKQSAKHRPGFSLVEALHASEAAFLAPDVEPLHKFTVTLEPPSFTQEKYNLYCRYQSEVHKDCDKSSGNFSRFLIDNPLHRAPIAYLTTPPAHLPTHYGAYHQMYRLDGELIAFGVVDVLPNCISSVYLVYSPKWAWASLGKLSALYEIALVHEINQSGIEDMKWQYMGFYVHSCAKMRYKGDYSPSFLLDPETYSWHHFEASKAQLDQYPYISFSTPDHFRVHPPVPEKYHSALSDSDEGEEFVPQNLFPLSFWNRVKVIVEIDDHTCAWTPAPKYGRWKEVQDRVSFVAHGLGEELSQEILFYVGQ